MNKKKEPRLLEISGDTAGTGIESLSLGDEELLKVISSDSFLKQLRKGMKGFSDEGINKALLRAKYSLSPQSEDDEEEED
jgi:hypothetical protein